MGQKRLDMSLVGTRGYATTITFPHSAIEERTRT